MLSHSNFQAALLETLMQRPNLNHPVVALLSDTSADHYRLLRMLALQGYQLTKEFSRYVAALAMNCPLREYMPRLATNLYEEETGKLSRTDNHYILMQRFLEGLKISAEEREAAKAIPTTQDLIDYRWKLVLNRNSFHCGAAAVLIGSEGQNLEKAGGRTRFDLLLSLAARYGYEERDLEFFKVHTTEDEFHVQDGLDIVSAVCTNAKMQEEALSALAETCIKFRNFFDGIYAEYMKAARL